MFQLAGCASLHLSLFLLTTQPTIRPSCWCHGVQGWAIIRNRAISFLCMWFWAHIRKNRFPPTDPATSSDIHQSHNFPHQLLATLTWQWGFPDLGSRSQHLDIFPVIMTFIRISPLSAARLHTLLVISSGFDIIHADSWSLDVTLHRRDALVILSYD